MPACIGKRRGRRLKSSKLCRSANLPNGCWWISHGIDQNGELPISEDVFLWKEDRYVCITKNLGDCASSKQKKNSNKHFLKFIGRKFCVAKRQPQAVVFKTGVPKHTPQRFSRVLLKESCSIVDRSNAHRFNGFCQCSTPSVAKHGVKPDSKKLFSRRFGATLLVLKDVKQPKCDDLQEVLHLAKGGNYKQLSLIGDLDRKKLTSHPGTCQFSDLFSRDGSARRLISVKLKRRSKHVSRLDGQAKKKPQDICSPMKSLACSKQHSSDTGARKKHADSSNEKLDANRQMPNKCPKNLAFGMEKDAKHANSCSMEFNIRNLSQKYRPKMLQDLIGQGLVARALSNAVSKGKVAPVCLFQGPQGTGKTSAARSFAMALNCISKKKKPCGLCCECTTMISGNASHVWEIDAASYNGIDLMRELVNSMGFISSGLRYKIVIINECHMFSCQTWSVLKDLFDEPPPNAVFVLITTEPCKLPYCITSRCHRFRFFRIRHADIVNRLCRIAKMENISTEPGALSLIALNSDGSLRSAENFLDQLNLLEQRITVATIHKLVGSVSHNELSRLLGLAFSSDIVRTVQKTKEIVELGVDPSDLLSQLAMVITDILAGSSVPMWRRTKRASSVHALSDAEMESLRTALKVLWEAEERIRAMSLSRTTWLIETLLRLGPSLKQKSQSACSSKILSKPNSPVLQCSERARSMKPKVCDKRRGVVEKRALEQMVSKGNRGRFQGKEGSTRILLKDAHFGQGSGSDQSSYAEVDSPGYHAEIESLYAEANFSANYDKRRQQPSRLLSSSTKQDNPSAANREIHGHMRSPCNIKSLWLIVLKHCRSLSVCHSLQKHAKLLALTFLSDSILAHVGIEKCADKLTMEMYYFCLTNSFKKVLGPSAELHFILASNLQ